MTLRGTKIPHAEIKEGVFVRSSKNPIFVRLVVGLLHGDVLYCDTVGHGACQIDTLRGWGTIEASPPEASDIMRRVAAYGGLEAMRQKAGIAPTEAPV